MLQLKINGTAYPEVRRGDYKCYKKDLGEMDRMISGRIVMEEQRSVWVIEYKAPPLSNEFMRKCLMDLRSGKDLTVEFLTPDSDDIQISTFFCTVRPVPTMEWSFGGSALWTNVAFVLEQVGGDV